MASSPVLDEPTRTQRSRTHGSESGTAYGPDGRTTYRNGYRERVLGTRAGTIPLRIPRLRQGSNFPWFLEPRRTAENALAVVIQEAYMQGVSTRNLDALSRQRAAARRLGLDRHHFRARRCRGSPCAVAYGRRPISDTLPESRCPDGSSRTRRVGPHDIPA